MKEYVIVIKDGHYWLAKAVEYPKINGLEEVIRKQGYADDSVKLEYITAYEIDTTLSHNGFEREVDAWSYIIHLQGFSEDKK